MVDVALTTRYVLGILLDCHEAAHYISYARNNTDDSIRLRVVPCGYFSDEQYGNRSSLPQLPLTEIDEVPLLYGEPRIERRANQLIVYADVIASVFFLLTRYEEIVRRDVRDEHGRFPGRESLPYRAGFLGRPIVDEYGKLLRRWLREVGVEVPEPAQGISKTYLTHDVDSAWRWPSFRSVCRSTLRNAIKAPRQLLDPLLCYTGYKKDPEDSFDWIIRQDMALQRKLGKDRIESVFFMMAGGTTPQDGYYDINGRRPKDLMKKLINSGAALGLHASYEAGIKPDQITQEARTLREVCNSLSTKPRLSTPRCPFSSSITSNRHHYLASREPEDLQQLEKAGITDDFTFAYADVAGFRLGTCRPVQWFDPIENRLTNITLHPMTLMECTLDRENYMNLDYEEAKQTCFSLFGQVKKHGGELVLLWHNTELTDDKKQNGSYQPQLYLDVLNWILENRSRS